MRTKLAPESCVTLTLFIVMMWNGTDWPWIGSRIDSASRSTASTNSADLGTGTADVLVYEVKSAIAPPLPPVVAACCAPTRRAPYLLVTWSTEFVSCFGIHNNATFCY